MRIKDSVVFVTGSNRGIGKAYVGALLQQGAKKVYAGMRDVKQFDTIASDWPQALRTKVEPVRIDITNPDQVQAAAKLADDTTLLINNGGIAQFAGLIAADSMDAARQEMEVNYFGSLAMTRAFVPVLKKNGGGAIVNICSVASLGNFPVLGSYSASKAALHSLTQGIRAELASQGIEVYGVYPGPIDTDMAESFELDKGSPEETAQGTINAIEAGQQDIFVDAFAEQFYKDFRSDPKELEQQLTGFLPA